ncbi:DEHA2C11484p [Debaryomyces hansenii CBS767]|uniref:DEHA2C11484p n=1 Tax=Debaryomyces hansenii (strain ATCC 36239 / CBS 767 / BCRC 21394 / JCM 1990 / NBRC 0083 / IGC 2968) TaxID=284592 RepID=B5RT99_DEBHA|nr:DEHA2C11484p [Debaryomyces hansenii CBS767]CAR65561.1 DEHA2C11484p [Debaryomyces hansenii CBS767]|eukprot:XP_002770197.1 DEHA2C11484p [Debaryomyces hansenii CBS767]
MSFSCPPSELVSHILETLAFSGQHGISLFEMWEKVAHKLQSPSLDDFQKQVIWQWLFFYNESDIIHHSYIIDGDRPVAILPSYKSFLEEVGSERTLKIMPSSETQWRYLTGVGNSKRLKLQLGEYPFQLLCEIAKYGRNGIYAPDLCKATGQDPRSLTLRLRKLEELGFIIKKNVYNEKSSQHTSLCIHKKFSEDEIELAPSDFGEDFDSSRNVSKLKQFIMQSLKNAPNKLRGFKDLKSELKLDNGRSSGKFFRSIIEYLHKRGYAERLMVKNPNQSQLVYCIKYIKDIPKDADEISDYVDFFNELDDNPNQDDDDYENDIIPTFNTIFPLSNQLYQGILSTEKHGATSMELIRNLTGLSDYRPIIKLLDSLTSYVIDNGKSKALKNYSDAYDQTAIIRAYDFEGKFKFYRYFSTQYSGSLPSEKPKSSKKTTSTVENSSLENLNKKYFQPLGKVPQGSLVNSKKRKSDANTKRSLKKARINSTGEAEIKKPRGRPKKKAENGTNNVDAIESYPKASLLPGSDEYQSDGRSSMVETIPSDEKEEFNNSGPISLSDISSIKPPADSDLKLQRKKVASSKPSTHSGSLKAIKRRTELINIIKDLGGVTYTTANLCRLLDKRLRNSTITDKKTLARDVSLLINNGELEVQDIQFIRSGQPISRKLLILTSPDLKPSDEKIEEMKQQCLIDKGLRPNNQPSRRIIEGEVTIYSQPQISLTKKERKGRLESLSERDSHVSENIKQKKVTVKEENDLSTKVDVKLTDAKAGDPLSSLVSSKSKRKRKATSKKGNGTTSISNTKHRMPIKFDKSDATTLYRAVVISRTFKRGAIDFEKIATLFNDINASEIKSKWTSVRKLVGGLPAVMKGIDSFEYVVMRGIENGFVSASDLETINIQFFLDLWRDTDSSILEVVDKSPLYDTVIDNLEEYIFSEYSDHQQDLFEQLEDNSMRRKEAILSNTNFAYDKIPEVKKEKYDEHRTVLKAIFVTPEDRFSSDRVNQILSEYDDEAIKEASLALIKDKELSHSLDDSNTRFILTDRVHNAFISKIFTSKFFNQAAEFKNNMLIVSEASKGLILSHGILSGQMATLLHFLSDEVVDLIRVDKPYKFNGYESRLIDKEKLACDIIATGNYSDIKKENLKSTPIPTGKACSHIWLDLNGNINTQMWTKIIISILYYIVFRPGVPEFIIYSKLRPVLGYSDFHCVMKWLSKTNCIHKGKNQGYWVKNDWFSILGY